MIDRRDNPEFLNEFLDYSASIQNRSKNSIKEYNYDLVHFFKFLLYQYRIVDLKNEKEIKDMDIHYVTNMSFEVIKRVRLQDIHAFLSYLERVYDSKPTTRARKVSSIRIFFQYLTAKANRLEINPAQNLESPKLGKRMPKYLSLEDSRKLLDTVKPETDRNAERDYAILTLFLNCGMRLSELVGINLKDIDFSEEKMTVIGKGDKERTIYLNKACMKAINEYLLVRPKEVIKDAEDKDPLFVSERRKRISNRNVQNIVKQELLRAGLDIRKYSVHKLRHTAATLMYQYGNVDIRALQELLGHESIATTQIYTHVSNEQVRSAVENNPLADYNQ